MILPYENKTPRIASSVFLARGVVVSGDVEIKEESSIWYNTVIRGDVAPTLIGKRVNIQDNCTLHQSPGIPLIIEDDVSVGHNAILHSCHIKKGALIGMGAIVLDGAVIGEGAFRSRSPGPTQGRSATRDGGDGLPCSRCSPGHRG